MATTALDDAYDAVETIDLDEVYDALANRALDDVYDALPTVVLYFLSRRALATTNTLENAMAPAANMGDSNIPNDGYSAPAATGTSAAL